MTHPVQLVAVFASLFLAGSLFADSPRPSGPPPELPENLTPPPPLPPEIRNSNPGLPPDDLPNPADLIKQLKQLDELLRMTPEQLKKLRQTVHVIEQMSEDQRTAMRIRLSKITQTSPELKMEIQSFSDLIEANRVTYNDLTQFWLGLKSEDRETIREQLQKLSPDKQKELILDQIESFRKKKEELFQSMRSTLPPLSGAVEPKSPKD